MKAVDIPVQFPLAFAKNAAGGFTRQVPTASQIGVQAGAASLNDGFPPVCFLPVGAGGTPPFGQDFNGLYNQITGWNQWQGAGAPVKYDATQAAAIGGYPQGAVLSSATVVGYFWLCTIDDNISDPDAGGANWESFSAGGGTTGDMKFRITAETLPGWAKGNATTIGNAGSGAAQYATAAAFNLFAWFWNNFSNAQCPVLPGGRGASAAADFAALKTIATFDLRGTGIIGMDTMGGLPTTLLTGVPAVTGSATVPGSVLGENLHQLTTAELASHTHTISTQQTVTPFTTGVAGSLGQLVSFTSQLTNSNTGGDTPHNTVERSVVGTWYFKL